MRPETLAQQALADLGLTGPPVDLAAVAEWLGVDSRMIEVRNIAYDGRLDLARDKPRIVVAAGVGPRRRRFTIAHELGHVVVWRHGWVLGRVEEERFCNRFASALLLPPEWLKRDASSRAQDELRELMALAHTYRASLSATLLQLRKVADWRFSILRWKVVSERWLLIDVTGHGTLRLRLSPTSETLDVLAAAVNQRGQLVGRLPINIDRRPVRVVAQLRGSSAGASRAVVALADLRPLTRGNDS